MTHLYLQTFLLLLAAYFLGAFLGCWIKRAIFGARHDKPTSVAMAEAPIPSPIAVAQSLAPIRPSPPPVVPRSFDPVQPRIDVLRRPPPRPLPKLIDPSRFERALMGPELNEGVPRTAIVEICPTVLEPVTGADRPGPPRLPSEPEILPPPIASVPASPAINRAPPPREMQPSNEMDAEVPPVAPKAPQEEPVKRASLSDATTSAAAAAVAAAKAAAAASIVRTLRRDDAKPAVEPSKEEPVEDGRPKAVQVEEQVEGDKREDLQAGDDQLKDTPTDDMLSDGGPVDETPDKDSEAVEENIEETAEQFAEEPASEPPPVVTPVIESGDDFQRIRAIDAALEQRLKAEGIDSFEHIAAWSASDVDRIGQLLGISDRIDREQWVEQAQILAKGGETYYSRNRLAAQKAAAAAPETAELAVAGMPTEVEEPQSASEPASETPASEPAEPAVPEPAKPALVAQPASQLSGVAAAIQGRSVAEMAAAAAAAIAAASASVTRGLKPIEPISPLSKVDPKISIPAKLSDAIKEKEASGASPVRAEVAPPRPMTASSLGPHDDLKRIRGVGVLIEKRLNAMGIARYEQIANWTSGEIDRVSQVLEFKGRIEREGWVEQARILLNGGQTEFSRRVDRGEVDTSRET